MGLFDTRDTSTSRRLLFVVGALMLGTGLILTWFERGEGERRDPEASAALAEIINERLGLDDDPTPEPSDFDRRVAALDIDAAPRPLPERVDGEEYDVFVNTSAEFLVWFFGEIGYDAEHVAAGETVIVPPIILMSISRGWAEDKTVQLKKSLFYRIVLPLILLENDAVLEERSTIESYATKRRNRSPVTPEEREALKGIAVKYRILEQDDPGALDDDVIRELLLRVDAVPPSLALGQAAYESGYATSRFAYTGNALFGQWDWGADVIVPEERRKSLGSYGVRAFDFPIDSVRAYLWNLNTHRAYDDFRRARSRQRNGREGYAVVDGLTLAATLTSYSERGEAYTQELQGIIEFNELQRADDLRLIEGDPVFFD